MAENFVQIPPASTGLKMRTVENTVGANLVEQGVQTLADASGNLVTATSNRLDVNIQTTEIGIVTETAPASDTASSGLNGRMQRIAQRLTSLIALLPTSLGQKTMANGLAVTVASDQSALPVTGTFWQATQPVSGTVAISGTVTTSGPLTDTQIRATALPVSGTVTANAGTGTMAVSGPLTDTQLRATSVPVSGTFWQATQPVSGTVTVNALPAGSNIIGDVRVASNRNSTFTGFGSTFKIAGIAGTAGQKLFTMHNATGSTILVDISGLNINVQATAAKVVAPPNIRVHRITVLPTGGTAVPKIPANTSLTSSSSLTILQGASSDTAATAITATIPANNIVVTRNAERLLTLVGQDYQPGLDLLPVFGKTITLRALEGICIELVYTLATQNPVTDLWGVNVTWEEYS